MYEGRSKYFLSGVLIYSCKEFLDFSPPTLNKHNQNNQKIRKAIKFSRPLSEEGGFLFKVCDVCGVCDVFVLFGPNVFDMLLYASRPKAEQIRKAFKNNIEMSQKYWTSTEQITKSLKTQAEKQTEKELGPRTTNEKD